MRLFAVTAAVHAGEYVCRCCNRPAARSLVRANLLSFTWKEVISLARGELVEQQAMMKFPKEFRDEVRPGAGKVSDAMTDGRCGLRRRLYMAQEEQRTRQLNFSCTQGLKEAIVELSAAHDVKLFEFLHLAVRAFVEKHGVGKAPAEAGAGRGAEAAWSLRQATRDPL